MYILLCIFHSFSLYFRQVNRPLRSCAYNAVVAQCLFIETSRGRSFFFFFFWFATCSVCVTFQLRRRIILLPFWIIRSEQNYCCGHSSMLFFSLLLLINSYVTTILLSWNVWASDAVREHVFETLSYLGSSRFIWPMIYSLRHLIVKVFS